MVYGMGVINYNSFLEAYMNKLKKYGSIFIIFIIALSLISCTKNNSVNTVSKEQKESTTNESTANTSETKKATVKEVSTRKMPDWADKAIIYEVNVRQYTKDGTFNAFAEHLPRLKEMGINTLWFMPIYPIAQEKRLGSLGSYYSIADYKAINPEFGTLEDFKNLVNKAHEMGFTVILDWVANHTGWDHVWIKEHPDWYTQNSDDQIISPPGMGWNDVADLNYDNQDMRQGMIDAMSFWVKEVNVDGFRCDYATGVPVDFWEKAREELTKFKEVYMLAEDNSSKAFLVNAFDSNYNWTLFDNILSVAKGANDANTLKYTLNTRYPEGAFPLNFMDNHDKNSWDGSIISRFGKDTIPCMTTLMFTIPGAPLIYSGDEAGLDKQLKFFDKDEISWDSLPYEGLIKRLSEIKTENTPLYNGAAGGEAKYFDLENENIFALERVKDNKKITAIFNLSRKPQSDSTIDLEISKDATILIHGIGSGEAEVQEKAINKDELTKLTNLEPWEYYVISSTIE